MRMNKYLVILMMFVVIVLTGCGSTYEQATGCASTYEEATGQPPSKDFLEGYFTEVYNWGGTLDHYPSCHIVYANDTKVMYIILGDSQYYSGISPLYNSDGSLQIYNKGEKND